jgi:1-acyl-sn-glycerol-3-phosphate acyltransferase
VIQKLFGSALALIRLFFLVLTMAIFIGFGLILVYTRIFKQNHAFVIRTFWCKLACVILGIKIYKTGHLDLSKTQLYIGNHRSLIDPVIVFSFLTNGYAVSKSEVENYPLISQGAKLSGVIFVHRTKSESRTEAKNAILEFLNKNYSILIFPEGTISTTRELLPFKKGSIESAVAANKQISSFALEYMNPKRDFWWNENLIRQFILTFSKWKTEVRIHFFDPESASDPVAFTAKIKDRIQSKITDFQTHWKDENLPDLLR